MKQPRPLKALAGLTADQLDQLAQWIEVHSYRKAVELAREKFGRYIPKTTLQRFVGHARVKDVLDDSPDALRAAREINRFAATAQTEFSSATIHLLERQAFELALARANQQDFDHLKDLLFLVQRHRANDLHERRVRVQEQKLALRQAEQAQATNTVDEAANFSAIVDHVLKNHPAFPAASAVASALDSVPAPARNPESTPPLHPAPTLDPVSL